MYARGGDQPYLSSAGEHILEIRFGEHASHPRNSSLAEVARSCADIGGVLGVQMTHCGLMGMQM